MVLMMTLISTRQGGEADGAPPECPPSPRHRILVVEDDHDIRRLNAEVLARSGYQVDAAEDGAAAWDALQVKDYDIMVTDNDMPKLTGVELLHKLHSAQIALPVIMATGLPPEDKFAQYPWLQPAAMLLKPYSIHELLETVQEVLRATGTIRE